MWIFNWDKGEYFRYDLGLVVVVMLKMLEMWKAPSGEISTLTSSHLPKFIFHRIVYKASTMDVKELMMFKPSQTPKRPNPSDPSKSQEEVEEDTGDSYEARAKKRKLALKKAQEVGE